MKIHAIAIVALATALHALTAAAAERSGREIVDSHCISCHGSGQAGAPKIGDRQAWAKRAEKGLGALTKTALQGVRQMPPHGGATKLTDRELARAITDMVNRSGGTWIEPGRKAGIRSGKEVVEARCAQCHGPGTGGAPKIGDRTAWNERLKYGLDAVVMSAIRGHGAMQPRGGMAELTDVEVRNAVVYMFRADPQ